MGVPFDQLHHEIRSSRVGRTGIEHLGDVRVIHQGQGLPLGLEPRHHFARVHAGLDDLQGHGAADGLASVRPCTRRPCPLRQSAPATCRDRSGCRGVRGGGGRWSPRNRIVGRSRSFLPVRASAAGPRLGRATADHRRKPRQDKPFALPRCSVPAPPETLRRLSSQAPPDVRTQSSPNSMRFFRPARSRSEEICSEFRYDDVS